MTRRQGKVTGARPSAAATPAEQALAADKAKRPKYLAPDGQTVYPSVTTILGEAVDPEPLMQFAHRLGREKKSLAGGRSAAAHGTAVHIGIDEHLRWGKAPTIGEDSPREVRVAFDAWETWWREASADGLQILATEVQLVHDAWGVGGTIDVIARGSDGALIVGDWKTSRGTYPEHVAQVAAYSVLLAEGRPNLPGVVPGLGEATDRALVVRLPKWGRPVAEPYWFAGETLTFGLHHFRGAHGVYEARRRLRTAIEAQQGPRSPRPKKRS